MSNRLYDKARESFLKGEIAWLTDDIRVLLVDTGAYTPNFSTDQYLADIPGGARIATSGALGSKTVVAGVADAADPTWTAVSGVQSEAVVVYQNTGVAATSRLIAYIDSATGLPVTPNGGDITVQFDNGSNKIFKL
jgi:hypothetical protein